MAITSGRVAATIAMGAMAISLLITLRLSDSSLTPLIFAANPKLIPGIKWTVFGFELVALGASAFRPAQSFGLAAASGLALSNLLALSLNGLGAMMFSRYEGQTDSQGILLMLFLAAQVVALTASVSALSIEKQLRRSQQVAWALAVVVVSGTGQWLLARSMGG